MKVAKAFIIITIVAFMFTTIALGFGLMMTFPFTGYEFSDEVLSATDIINVTVVYNALVACIIFICALIILYLAIRKRDPELFITERFVAVFVAIAVVCIAIGAVPAIRHRSVAAVETYTSTEHEHKDDGIYSQFLPYKDSSDDFEICKYNTGDYIYNRVYASAKDMNFEYRATYYKSNSLVLRKLYEKNEFTEFKYASFDENDQEYTWYVAEFSENGEIDGIKYKLYENDRIFDLKVKDGAVLFDCNLYYENEADSITSDEFVKTAIEQYKLLSQTKAEV
ncbi:MAG: hypothetical protein NC110_04250 [Ruminococcus sp.]|nr:hypothetical protein [Ruminococcus sp.]